MIRILLLVAVCSWLILLLGGCGSLEGKFENRIACTLAKDKAFVVSEYGPLGISSVIAEQDRKEVCK